MTCNAARRSLVRWCAAYACALGMLSVSASAAFAEGGWLKNPIDSASSFFDSASKAKENIGNYLANTPPDKIAEHAGKVKDIVSNSSPEQLLEAAGTVKDSLTVSEADRDKLQQDFKRRVAENEAARVHQELLDAVREHNRIMERQQVSAFLEEVAPVLDEFLHETSIERQAEKDKAVEDHEKQQEAEQQEFERREREMHDLANDSKNPIADPPTTLPGLDPDEELKPEDVVPVGTTLPPTLQNPLPMPEPPPAAPEVSQEELLSQIVRRDRDIPEAPAPIEVPGVPEEVDEAIEEIDPPDVPPDGPLTDPSGFSIGATNEEARARQAGDEAALEQELNRYRPLGSQKDRELSQYASDLAAYQAQIEENARIAALAAQQAANNQGNGYSGGGGSGGGYRRGRIGIGNAINAANNIMGIIGGATGGYGGHGSSGGGGHHNGGMIYGY